MVWKAHVPEMRNRDSRGGAGFEDSIDFISSTCKPENSGGDLPDLPFEKSSVAFLGIGKLW